MPSQHSILQTGWNLLPHFDTGSSCQSSLSRFMIHTLCIPSSHLFSPMSFTRLPLLRSTLVRSLHTSRPAFIGGQASPAVNDPALDPVPASAPSTSPTAPHPADVVAGKVVGPITTRLSAGEITAETTSGAPSMPISQSLQSGLGS
jgi:hypothetical protein